MFITADNCSTLLITVINVYVHLCHVSLRLYVGLMYKVKKIAVNLQYIFYSKTLVYYLQECTINNWAIRAMCWFTVKYPGNVMSIALVGYLIFYIVEYLTF